MQDLTPVVADDEKAVQNTKSERWDGEKVHRSNGLAIISDERQPSLHRVWISRGSPDPSRDTPFREIETQLEQFAVNARRSRVGFSATIRRIKPRTSLLTRFLPPTWLILETHVQYKRNPARCQFTTVLGVTKTRGCLHPDHHILNATQNSLCRAVNRRRGRCACRASNCPTESQVFEDEVRPATERTDQPAEEMSERHDHGKNLSGKDRIKLCAKSFISQVCNLLARHRPFRPARSMTQSSRSSAFCLPGGWPSVSS
jgi:hypothetical protein